MDALYTQMDSPIGPLWVASSQQAICKIGLNTEPEAFLGWLSNHIAEPRQGGSEMLGAALMQLKEYFASDRRAFDLPLDMRGTDFQRLVWEETARIPYGKTVSYGKIAGRIGKPKAARAVGGALGANPLPIIVPCHRVVGADETLTGYGAGLDVKAALLRLEGVERLAGS